MDGFRQLISHRKALLHLAVIAMGTGMILLSLFAFQLRLDNRPGWGPHRIQMLEAGLAVIIFGSLYWIRPVLSDWFEISCNLPFAYKVRRSLREIHNELGKSINDSRLIRTIKRSTWFAWISKNHVNLWLMLIACCVLWIYIWIITIGRIDKWPSGRDYYWLLTQAFQKGQTYLLVDPNPELLKLQNPYDLQQRKGLDYLWDTTLYNGKYYLYWGPVPAVLGVFINFMTSKPITDAELVFSFVIGTALFSVLLLRKLYQDNHFSEWIFWGGVLASVINIPLIWLFTHPAYYEASIAGGQCFMMAGFFLVYLGFRSSLHKGYMVLSALAFGLAGATRINLLPSVIFLGFMILWRVYIAHNRNLRASIPTFVITLIPLVIIAWLLSWYNYARFGSIFEFGHRYQLTGLSSTSDEKDQISIHYIVPNIYSYAFRSPSLRDKFPFVTIPAIKQNMWPFFVHPPENYYYAEPVAGIFFTIPLIALTALLLLRLLWLVANGDISLKRFETTTDHPFIWFAIPVLGYVLVQTGILFIFISASMRYLFDVIPALIILSTMLVGTDVQSFEERPYVVKIILSFWIAAAVLTVILGVLIGFTGAENNFLNKNPQLYYQLLRWFSR